MNHEHTAALLGASLFIILSSSAAYKMTSVIVPTKRYGCPTRFGLLLHGIVFGLVFLLLEKHI